MKKSTIETMVSWGIIVFAVAIFSGIYSYVESYDFTKGLFMFLSALIVMLLCILFGYFAFWFGEKVAERFGEEGD